MKKFMSLALALVMTMSMTLTACSGGGSTPTPSPKPTPVTVDGVTAPETDVRMDFISAENATKLLNSDDYTFIDVRKAADYKTSHIPGSVNYDMDAAKNGDFAAGVATMKEAIKDTDDTLILVCYSGKSYAQATTNVLTALGYEKVVTLAGGFNNWSSVYPSAVEPANPGKDAAMQYITANEAIKLLADSGYVFLDIRKAADYATSHIPGALGYDMDAAKNGDFVAGLVTMSGAVEGMSKNTKLILVCYSGKRYAQAATNALTALGFNMANVYTLEGGFTNWSKVYPNVVEPVNALSGTAMNYIKAEDAVNLMGNAEYTFLDIRKADDYKAGHIPGAVSFDMDAAKNGDFNAGVITMSNVLKNYDNNLILICYSGKRYAQATTDVLAAMGYDMSKVLTLEGGFTNWSKTFADKVEASK